MLRMLQHCTIGIITSRMRQDAAPVRPGCLGSGYLAEYPVSDGDQQADAKEGA